MSEVKTPTQKQIDHCEVMGWDYIGEGLFESKKQSMMGWFTDLGFNKVSLCEVMGWSYIGDGLFEPKKRSMTSWFTESGFNKELL